MIIDGVAIASEIQHEIKKKVQDLKKRTPSLAVILVGEDSASRVYINRKVKACDEVGIRSIKKEFPNSVGEEHILKEIEKLNKDDSIDGILVQLPLPKQINSIKVMHHIDPKKDVDGFHPMNVGKMLIGETDGFFPCTPLGIKVMIDHLKIETHGKHIVIIGRSNIVGKPLAALLLQKEAGFNATVTVVNRHTPNIKEICHEADILIVAIGQAKYVTQEMVKKDAIVIDVGINKIEKNGKKILVGDVDFEGVKNKCKMISPVPGGVGPMTIAMLLSNTFLAFSRSHS